MVEDQTCGNRSIRQPWLPDYLASSAAVEAKPASRFEQDGDGCARVCAHCGTSKTPLWRNGPGGPKVFIAAYSLYLLENLSEIMCNVYL